MGLGVSVLGKAVAVGALASVAIAAEGRGPPPSGAPRSWLVAALHASGPQATTQRSANRRMRDGITTLSLRARLRERRARFGFLEPHAGQRPKHQCTGGGGSGTHGATVLGSIRMTKDDARRIAAANQETPFVNGAMVRPA